MIFCFVMNTYIVNLKVSVDKIILLNTDTSTPINVYELYSKCGQQNEITVVFVYDSKYKL